MSGTLVNLIIQVIAGILGGNGIGAALKDASLGPLGNSVAGAIGGGLGGQVLQGLIPALAGAAGGGLDIGSLVGGEAIALGSFGADLIISAGIALAGCIINAILVPARHG